MGQRVPARRTPLFVSDTRQLLASKLLVHLRDLLGQRVVACATGVARDARFGREGAADVLHRSAEVRRPPPRNRPLHLLRQAAEELLLISEERRVAKRTVTGTQNG